MQSSLHNASFDCCDSKQLLKFKSEKWSYLGNSQQLESNNFYEFSQSTVLLLILLSPDHR